MTKQDILELLHAVKNGEATPEETMTKLKLSPFEDLGYAKLDYHRAVRQGSGEVIYGAGKTPEQIDGIVRRMSADGIRDILITRMSPEAAKLVEQSTPLVYHPIPRIGIAAPLTERRAVGNIVIASGGTSDMAVCEEAALTAELLGNRVTRLYDVGVSGLHRLLSHMDVLAQARVVIAVAGMEGALASVVGGLVDCPVIGVPTSIGYGANFGGVSALLSMLNSCASGVSVVNIDNGFGAAYQASMINQMGSGVGI
ncbi:MAG: nickel pincer cofactor biosynthesis protein LarB [Angelakisella sp.]